MNINDIVIFGGFIAVAAVFFLFYGKIRKGIEERGIEADGIIDRIETDQDPVDMHITESWYVTYWDENGYPQEGLLLDPPDLEEGTRVRIKYDPERPGNVILVDVIDRDN